MSGTAVSLALQHRFDTIRQAEIDVIRAIARVPHRELNDDIPTQTLRALVHLFELPRH